jgi:hypothetical protein
LVSKERHVTIGKSEFYSPSWDGMEEYSFDTTRDRAWIILNSARTSAKKYILPPILVACFEVSQLLLKRMCWHLKKPNPQLIY